MALNNIDQLFNNIPDIKEQNRKKANYKYKHSDKGKISAYNFSKTDKAKKLFYNYNHSDNGIIRRYKYKYNLKDFDKNEIKQLITLKNNLFNNKCNNINYLLHIYDLFNINI